MNKSRKNKSKMGPPRKYTGEVKLRAVKIPMTDAEFERVKTTTDPRQRAAVLLKLCDDIDAARAG